MTLDILPASFLEKFIHPAKPSTKRSPKRETSQRTIKIIVGRDESSLASRIKKLLEAENATLALREIAVHKEVFLRLTEFDLLALNLKNSRGKVGGAFGYLNASVYGLTREVVGAALRKHLRKDQNMWEFHFENLSDDAVLGALVGLEMSQYAFVRPSGFAPEALRFFVKERPVSKALLLRGERLGRAINLARHLVNLPPNELNPVNYADAIKRLFAKSRVLSVEVWDEKRLAREKLELLAAVGRGSQTPPRLVKLSYRPGTKKAGSTAARIVFVGKGITFDSGGLDLKPAAAMRLMKKDMGGSASVLGLAYWIESSGLKHNIDFYLALAENAVGSRSFRPSDVYQTRKGLTIEIDNTDAEGRLALADALTLALEGSQPEYLIDLATLTGAGKVALGTELASLFVSDDAFAKQLLTASQETEDLSWPMPLWEKYDALYKSSFADHANSGAGGFAGAITAALFLKKFVDPSPVKWAHFDIYGWKDAPEGPFSDKGGNGQCVQALSRWLENLKN
jgi:leucyl aminopeptidase